MAFRWPLVLIHPGLAEYQKKNTIINEVESITIIWKKKPKTKQNKKTELKIKI